MKSFISVVCTDDGIVTAGVRAIDDFAIDEKKHTVSTNLDVVLPDDVIKGLQAVLKDTAVALAKQHNRAKVVHTAAVMNRNL